MEDGMQLSDPQAASDDVLMARIAQGDRRAMQALYGRHHVRVFRFGLRLVRNERLAEELMSDVFLDVWRQAGCYEGRSAVSTWLLTVTRFKALSALRRHRDSGRVDEGLAMPEDLSDDSEVAVSRMDPCDALRRCLNGLPPQHREIVDLVYYHEKSVAEVAEIVGIPQNTVKTRLSYARRKLADLLRAVGVERDWP
jgi:RNA polymerase sigma-70 factor (ECF subfamily)